MEFSKSALFTFGGFLCIANSAFAQQLNSLSFLDEMVQEAERKVSQVTLAQQDQRIREAQLNTAQAGYLPTFSADASTGPSKSYKRNESGLINSEENATWNSKAGVAMKQNIYQNGATELSVKQGQFQVESAILVAQQAKLKLRVGMVVDLLRISFLRSRLRESQKLLLQAQDLEKIASRKQKSGLLGVRDLLETRRELFRTRSEVSDASGEVMKAAAAFNRNYKLDTFAIRLDARGTESRAMQPQKNFEKIEKDLQEVSSLERKKIAGVLGSTEASEKDFQFIELAKMPKPQWKYEILQPLFQSNVTGKIRRREVQTAQFDLEFASQKEYRPSLDFLAGADYSLYDNRNASATVAKALPDSDITMYGRLSFSMQLYGPQSSAQAKEQLEKLQRSTLLLSDFERSFEDAVQQELEKYMALLQKAYLQRELSRMSEDLRDKNVRLFEAGEFDVLNVISSQQDLSKQAQQYLEIDNQLNVSALNLLVGKELGYYPPVEAGGAAQASQP